MGQILKDTYRIDRLIGEGGTGLVYLGFHQRLKIPIAVKVLKQSSGDVAFQRFRKEAEITARLRHPNIVQVLDYDVTPDGHAYLVTEWLEGETLGQHMKRVGAMDERAAVTLLAGVCEAVSAAHTSGIVHRDLKPANIFLSQAAGAEAGGSPPLVKVLDFGIAKLTELDPVRTEQGQTVGTPRYMSPEQIKLDGDGEVGPPSDQFSLGAIAYELVAGRPAFPGSAHAAMIAVMEGKPQPLSRTVSAGYRAAVTQALSLLPADRFATVGDFHAALRRAVTPEEDPVAVPLPRGLLLGGAAVAGALLALVILLTGPRGPVAEAVDLRGRAMTVTALDATAGPADLRPPGAPPPTDPPDGAEPDEATRSLGQGPRIEVHPQGLKAGTRIYINGRPAGPRLLLPEGRAVRLRAVPPPRSCCDPAEQTYVAGAGRPPPVFKLRCDRDCPW